MRIPDKRGLLCTLVALAAAAHCAQAARVLSQDTQRPTLHLDFPVEASTTRQCKPDNLTPSEHRLTGEVVMGFASNFNYKDHLHILVSSFLRHVPGATLLLFVEAEPSEWPSHLDGPDSRVRFVTVKTTTGGDHGKIINQRHAVYLCFLQAAAEVKRVLLVDTRDTVFQASPFQAYADEVVHFFQESSHYSINEEYMYNKRWLQDCTAKLGKPNAGKHYGAFPIINAGSFLGPSAGMQRYLSILVEKMETVHCDVDQGLHNALIYSGVEFGLPPFRVDSNEMGRWFTAGLKYAQGTYTISGFQIVSKANGKVFVGIHQYDRSTDLTAHFQELYPLEGGHHAWG